MGTLLKVLQLIPTITAVVKALEAELPIPNQGKSKLDFILGVVSDLYKDSTDLIGPITTVVTRLVGLFNAVGMFKTSPK
jgi:hypothetical protein